MISVTIPSLRPTCSNIENAQILTKHFRKGSLYCLFSFQNQSHQPPASLLVAMLQNIYMLSINNSGTISLNGLKHIL